MLITTRQLSKIAAVSEQTVRNYTRDYAELLSPKARGDDGARLFSDEDVQIFCTIANLRKEDVPQTEIIARLKRGDVVVDATPSPHQATPKPQEGQGEALAVHVALSTMQAQINTIQRTQTTLLRAATLWGALLGAIAALVAGGFVLWVMWLIGSG